MGAMQRRKGHAFERDIAKAYRAKWPELASEIRRSQQSHSAFEPDVVVPGVPLWTECQCSANPTPLVKLAQAERDVERCTEPMYPVVVWRKSGSRTTWATMRMWTLEVTLSVDVLDLPDFKESLGSGLVTTVDFDEWLANVGLS